MTSWRALGERVALFPAVGQLLVDDLTGGRPIGAIRPALDLLVNGRFQPVTARALVTEGGVLAWVGLGRAASTAAPVRRYRLRVECDNYRPLYLSTSDGVEFDVAPYTDLAAPATWPMGASELVLAPSVAYPYPATVRVLRGRVVDAAGRPVENALVVEGARERVLTDHRGEFGLPLRFAPLGAPVPIDASDRTGRTGTATVQLPADLSLSHTIVVT